MTPIQLPQWGDTNQVGSRGHTTNSGHFPSRPTTSQETNNNDYDEGGEEDDEEEDEDDDESMANVIPFAAAATMSNTPVGSVGGGSGGVGGGSVGSGGSFGGGGGSVGKVKSLNGMGSSNNSINSQNTSRSILTMRRLSERVENEDEDDEEDEHVRVYDPIDDDDDFRYAVAGRPHSTGMGGGKNGGIYEKSGTSGGGRMGTTSSRMGTLDHPYTVKLSHLNEAQRRDRSLFLALKPLHGREGVLLSNAKPIPRQFLPVDALVNDDASVNSQQLQEQQQQLQEQEQPQEQSSATIKHVQHQPQQPPPQPPPQKSTNKSRQIMALSKRGSLISMLKTIQHETTKNPAHLAQNMSAWTTLEVIHTPSDVHPVIYYEIKYTLDTYNTPSPPVLSTHLHHPPSHPTPSSHSLRLYVSGNKPRSIASLPSPTISIITKMNPC